MSIHAGQVQGCVPIVILGVSAGLVVQKQQLQQDNEVSRGQLLGAVRESLQQGAGLP